MPIGHPMVQPSWLSRVENRERIAERFMSDMIRAGRIYDFEQMAEDATDAAHALLCEHEAWFELDREEAANG